MFSFLNKTAFNANTNDFNYKRIAIIGPTGSGKSTLTKIIAEKYHLPCCHLDQLSHLQGTQWQERPKEEFYQLHDNYLATHDTWVIDGNYSACLPQRLAAADCIIWLNYNCFLCVLYVIKRYLFDKKRNGVPEGVIDRFPWLLIKRLLFIHPQRRKKYYSLINQSQSNFSPKRVFIIKNRRQLADFCRQYSII